ncbi:hypothetical protein QX201_011818 [Fusarium graminearum]
MAQQFKTPLFLLNFLKRQSKVETAMMESWIPLNGKTISVFRYLNRAEISGAVPRLRRLHEIHQEFDYNWYRARTDNARKWVIEQLDLIENAFQKASPVPANFKTVMDTVAEFKTEARLIRPPPEDPKKYH